MAFTTIIGADGTPNVSLDQGNATDSPNPYFHPKDISRVLNQEGVVAVQAVNAVVGRAQNQRHVVVLIGLAPNNHGVPAVRAVDTNLRGVASGLATLPCPPFNHDDAKNIPMDPPVPAQ